MYFLLSLSLYKSKGSLHQVCIDVYLEEYIHFHEAEGQRHKDNTVLWKECTCAIHSSLMADCKPCFSLQLSSSYSARAGLQYIKLNGVTAIMTLDSQVVCSWAEVKPEPFKIITFTVTWITKNPGCSITLVHSMLCNSFVMGRQPFNEHHFLWVLDQGG